MEFGRGGAYVPAVSPHKGAFIVHPPRTMRVFFLYGNAAARTFGRAHRHRPYGFVWVDYAQTVDVVWVDCAWMFAPYAFLLDR